MEPQQQHPQQWQPQQPWQVLAPPPREPRGLGGGTLALLWIILVALLANLGFTYYVWRVVYATVHITSQLPSFG